ENLGDHLNTAAGTAELLLGKKAVSTARSIVAQSLKQFGFGNAQIKVASSNENTIFYAVSVQNGVGFKVPVKIADKKVISPSYAMCGTNIVDFSREGISSLVGESYGDRNSALRATAAYDLQPDEILTE